MPIINARDIASTDTAALWSMPDRPMKIQFDDGVLQTHARSTIFSAYVFGPFYRRYPNCPALMAHHIGKRMMGAGTLLDMIGKVLFDAYDASPGADIEDLTRLAAQVNNAIYNDFTYALEEYVGSLNALDFLEVIDYAPIAKINSELLPTEASINHAYDGIKHELYTSKELATNPICKALSAGVVDVKQVLQCVGPRGRCTDTDSNIFRTAVMHGYAHGIQSLAESMIESRSAAKALMFTKDPLQESQYTNRKIQLLAGTLMRLHSGDCGGGRLMPRRLEGRDLSWFAGKWYLREEDMKSAVIPGMKPNYRILRESDKHLINEMIWVRTLFECKHPDPQGICSACYGDLALSIPRGTVVGHIAATVLCEAISQILLSTKHLDNSASQEGTVLSDYDLAYMEENVEANTIRLAARLENAKLAIIVQSREANRINDVTIVDDLSLLTPSSLTALSDIKLEITTASGTETVTVHVSDEVRKSFFTIEALEHIRKYRWTLTAAGDYRIDLTHWDVSFPLLELPLKQVNMLEYMFKIEKFLRASDKGKKTPTLRTYNTPEAGLMRLYELVSSRLKFNIAHLECLVKTCMIRSSAHWDYRMPVAGNAVEFGRYNEIMAMRSMGAAMAYESHGSILFNPLAFVVDDRPDHPLDAMLRG